jgi:hypothetical protein
MTITTFRGPDKMQWYSSLVGKDVRLVLNEKKKNSIVLAIATITSTSSKVIMDMTPEEVMADTYHYWTVKTFIVYMRRMYKRKIWWQEGKTSMTCITMRIKEVLT